MPPHRRPRKSPGALPLTSQRDQYRALMQQGMSNAEACRVVGVNRKTGHRWRYGRAVTTRTGEIRTYAAITGPPVPVSPRYLSEPERLSIADGLALGLGVRAIAMGLGRSPSTVSREIRRNRDEEAGAYHPYRAGRHAAGRRARPRRGKLAQCLELQAFVTRCLERRWSPEQTSTMLRRRFPGRPEMRAAPETIYRALYAIGPDRLQSGKERLLRSRRLHRKRRRRPGERLGRSTVPMV